MSSYKAKCYKYSSYYIAVTSFCLENFHIISDLYNLSHIFLQNIIYVNIRILSLYINQDDEYMDILI